MNAFYSLFSAEEFSPLAIVLGMPLLGAFVNGVWGKRLGKEAVKTMALSAMAISFFAALFTFAALNHHVDSSAVEKVVEGHKVVEHEHVKLSWLAWEWMRASGAGGLSAIPIQAKFSVDALSGIMMLVITGIGFLIHLYASNYMETDKGYWRFFAYLNLFVFSMLILVLGDNLPLLFVGWEGVGLCSYLLIGFWYDKLPNAAAGKKAFIANRVGDFGLICAMFLIAHYCGALDWSGIEAGAKSLLSPDMVHVWPFGNAHYDGWAGFLQPKVPLMMTGATAVCACLLLGATGKSAQMPLYVWLPDAMAGPTPVSALIHAATMVTAGIYLICRLNFVFVLAPGVMAVIAGVGAFTALFAATIALVQNDLKKVLAYSTVSQLGFMFLGVGSGSFTAGFFHVLTHAFFKACLFLAAGSVIHAMHARVHDDEKSQDMRMMGGLKKYMPLTYGTFGAATLAIIGFPLTSGFFSKDEILFRSFSNSYQWVDKARAESLKMWMPPAYLGKIYYVMGVLAATLTAFYMCRAFFLTFYGDFKGWKIGKPVAAEGHDEDGHDDHGDDHHHDDLTTPGAAPHESPRPMTIPLIILAALAVFGGLLNPGLAKSLFHLESIPLEHWLEPVFATSMAKGIHEVEHNLSMELMCTAGAFSAFAIGSGIAYWTYIVNNGAPAKQWAAAAPGLHKMLMAKWMVDELYDATAISMVDGLADTFVGADKIVVDGILAQVTSFLAAAFGTAFRAVQNGMVHVYAAAMVVGVAGFSWFFAMPHAEGMIVDKGNGDFIVSAAPGFGYEYKFDDAQKFGATSEKPVHLDLPAADKSDKAKAAAPVTKNVVLTVKNVFGYQDTKTFVLVRTPAKDKQMIGQN
jgi:NADH-quinone oxidoreductase subunit L